MQLFVRPDSTGGWPVASVHWPLATGHWPLATGQPPLPAIRPRSGSNHFCAPSREGVMVAIFSAFPRLFHLIIISRQLIITVHFATAGPVQSSLLNLMSSFWEVQNVCQEL